MEIQQEKVNKQTRKPPSEESRVKKRAKDKERREKQRVQLKKMGLIEEEKDNLERELKRVNKINTRMEQLESNYTMSMDQLKLENNMLEKRVKQLEMEKSSLEKKMEQLEVESGFLEKKIKQLKMDKDDMEMKVNVLVLDKSTSMEQLMMLKNEMEQLIAQNTQLMENIQYKESMEVEWSKRMEIGKINQIIMNNTVSLIQQLPHNSPYRRPFLFFLLQDVQMEQAISIYGLSERSYRRIQMEQGTTLTEQKYAINVKRQRVSERQREEIDKILDDILPIQSGRNWRYQEATDKKIYEQYLAEVEHGQSVSKTFFIYEILAKQNIHHSKSVKFCPICERAEAGNSSKEVKRHLELIPIQRGAYHADKKAISSGNVKTMALITQDFTQLELDGSFVQDLIICRYSHDPKAQNGLQRDYRHFVGRTGDKNNISFVIGAWLTLLESNWLKDMDIVKIWSDGGPKHFKISSNMRFLLSIQKAQPSVDWDYNFFPPYHGCSICDGVAAQAKGILNRTSRDDHIAVRTSNQAVAIVQQLTNHSATTVQIPENDFSANTLKGIKSFFRFTAHKHKDILYAYGDSVQKEYEKRFSPRELIELSDLM